MTTRSAGMIVAASALVASVLWAQTPSPTPATDQRAANAPASGAPARTNSTAGGPADARVCLEFPTTMQVIQCAEKYRNRKARG
jgi:hypothetical protein